MTIMVDELRVFPGARFPFTSGSCHLTTDGPLEELHEFAARLGLRREWFQEHRLAPHYDLTIKLRARAIERGAIEVSAREQAKRRRSGH